jgi:hypothetical protein
LGLCAAAARGEPRHYGLGAVAQGGVIHGEQMAISELDVALINPGRLAETGAVAIKKSVWFRGGHVQKPVFGSDVSVKEV